ncbi:ribonuclease H-like domain, reverse transcriptase, RNA-dependent DNA polymerase [Tanacetum coccineum]|uniref:Ribonuclease H-like domain, reverse transcriptase, RNA-dependent DNA polymerase n=1 Tax=Tanacetum coccineum TaxID=301880 RepID=A0ABQ4Y1I2_9ASTR
MSTTRCMRNSNGTEANTLNGTRIKSYRLFDPTTQRVCVSRDVKFKENETWDWKDYISEHTDDEPEWTDFRIGNLEVANKHHDHETQPLEEDNEFPNNNDDDYASPRNSPLHPQTPHTPSTHSSEVNSQVTPNTSTQSYYQSDNESIQILNSPSHFDHTPVRAISIRKQNLKGSWNDRLQRDIDTMDPGTRLTKITEGTMVNSTEYRSLIGCLRYLLHTRPDLSYSVGLLSRFMQEPREQHMKAIRQVLRYVKGTKDHGITYKHNGGNKIHESPISWSIQKQATVALSSCESEFIATTAAATQALWLKRLLSKLTHTQEEKITIQVDNKSAIALMKNPVFHGRSKHIDTKYHFIRECVEREDIQVEFVSGEYQKANILTKALPKIKFLTMRQLIGLKDLSHSAYD